MLNIIFSSNIVETGLLIDSHRYGTECEFLSSHIINLVDIFSIENSKYETFNSLSHLEDLKKKEAPKNAHHLCTYVIFDGKFKFEIAYAKEKFFYASLEQYSRRPEKNFFVDDAHLFSKFWDKDDGSFDAGNLSYYIQSNQLISITQNMR